MKNILLLCSTLLLACPIFAQTPAAELDFWLGDWNLRWPDTDSTEAVGTNRITRELDSQVMCEYFVAETGNLAGFKGRSWSVFDSRAKIWKQTWVDNQGSYLDFTGGKEGNTFVFKREFTAPNGTVLHQKMVFHDIQTDQFTWDWMRSTDAGENWQLVWRIYYTRQP
jgi:hypothetical protein